MGIITPTGQASKSLVDLGFGKHLWGAMRCLGRVKRNLWDF